MKDTNTNIAILGGGIAGLTTAIALRQKGFEPQIFESTPEFKPVGAGIALAANAMKAYRILGLQNDIEKQGKLIPSFNICSSDGKIIAKSNFKDLNKNNQIENFAIHRAKLHEILLSKLNIDNIFLNKRTSNITQKSDGVEIQFEDGTTHFAHYVIVAEGIHSKTRQILLPESTVRYAGYTCWRGISDSLELDIPSSTESWGKGKRFGIVPLSNQQIYWFACVNAPYNSATHKNYSIDDLKEAFKYFHDPVETILSNTSDSNMIWSDIQDLKPIHQYAFERLVLIGDAAHATTPNMGQGACQAIEDAVILANEMVKHKELQLAFESFEKRRMKRTHKIVKDSWNFGKIAHLENKYLVKARNFLLRKTPARVSQKSLEFLYDVDF